MPFSILSSKADAEPGPVAQVKEAMDKLLNLVVQQEEELREAKLMLKRANTEVLLYGKAPPPDYTASLGGDFESAQFMVAGVELLKPEQLFTCNQNEGFSVEEVEQIKSAVYYTFETTLSQLCIATCCEADRLFAYILINLLDEEVDAQTLSGKFDNALQRAVSLISRNYNIDLAVEISSLVYGYENLPSARLEVNKKICEKYSLEPLTHASSAFSAAQDQLIPTVASRKPDARLEQNFYQSILSHDLDMAQTALLKLINRDLETEDMPFGRIKLRFINHVESMLNILGIAASDLDYLYMRPLDTGEELLTLVDKVFADVLEIMSGNSHSRKVKIDAVAACIEENYSDSTLCLGKLCDQFGVSQSWLSRNFKLFRNVNILDYIHQQRILHVKEMLKDPEISIDTVWEASGFTNRRTFNRIFRKYEGISALEYRKELFGKMTDSP